MNKINAVVIAGTITSAVAYAEVRTEVATEDYKDFVVSLEIPWLYGSTSTCGGALLGGEYILTATHCMGGWNGDPIVIKQGLSRSNPEKEYVRNVEHLRSDRVSTYTDYLSMYVPLYQEEVKGKWLDENGDDKVVARDYHFSYEELAFYESRQDEEESENILRDLSLLKLEQFVPHNDAAPISVTYDGSAKLPIGEEVTFRGWGTLESTGMTSDLLMEFKVKLELMPHMVYEWVDTGELGFMGDPLKVPTPCTEESEECHFEPSWKNLFYNELVSLQPGDSGTPLIHEGKIIGIASSNTLGTQDGKKYRSEFVAFDTYTDWFVRTIDSLVFMPEVEIDIEEHSSVVVMIQNWTNADVDTQVANAGIDGIFEVFTDCGTLESKASCSAEIVVSESADIAEDGELYSLQLTSDRFIEVNLVSSVEVTDPDEGNGENPDEGNGQNPDEGNGENPDEGNGQNPDEGNGENPDEGNGQNPDEGNGENPDEGNGQNPDEGNGENPDEGNGQNPDEGNGENPDEGNGQNPDEGNGENPDEGNSSSGGDSSGGSMSFWAIGALALIGLRRRFKV